MDQCRQSQIGGRKYFVTFTDDYTGCCAVYFMRHKSEVLVLVAVMIEEVISELTTVTGKEVPAIISESTTTSVALQYGSCSFSIFNTISLAGTRKSYYCISYEE